MTLAELKEKDIDMDDKLLNAITDGGDIDTLLDYRDLVRAVITAIESRVLA